MQLVCPPSGMSNDAFFMEITFDLKYESSLVKDEKEEEKPTSLEAPSTGMYRSV